MGTLNTDLLELYYLCLALGFEGKYKLQGREQLRALIQDLGRDLQTRRGEVPRSWMYRCRALHR